MRVWNDLFPFSISIVVAYVETDGLIRAIKSDSTTGARPKNAPLPRGRGGGRLWARFFPFFSFFLVAAFEERIYDDLGDSSSREEDFEARLSGTTDEEDDESEVPRS